MKTVILLLLALMVSSCNTTSSGLICEQQCRENHRDYYDVLSCQKRCKAEFKRKNKNGY